MGDFADFGRVFEQGGDNIYGGFDDWRDHLLLGLCVQEDGWVGVHFQEVGAKIGVQKNIAS